MQVKIRDLVICRANKKIKGYLNLAANFKQWIVNVMSLKKELSNYRFQIHSYDQLIKIS